VRLLKVLTEPVHDLCGLGIEFKFISEFGEATTSDEFLERLSVVSKAVSVRLEGKSLPTAVGEIVVYPRFVFPASIVERFKFVGHPLG